MVRAASVTVATYACQHHEVPAGDETDGHARDACAVCGTHVPPRPGGTQVVAGARVDREIGSCRSCGLQLVRFAGESWREIRG